MVTYTEVDPKTGIDPDIIHNYNALGFVYFLNGMPGIRTFLKEYHAKFTYKGHFNEVDLVILDSHNQSRIRMLDKLAVKTKEILLRPDSTPQDLIEIIRKATRIAQGRELDNSYIFEMFPGIEFQMQFEYQF